MEKLEKLFETHSLRLTTPRKIVFDILLEADQPLFIRDIIARADRVERTSIYRTLELFESLSIIEIIHTAFKQRYELAGPFKPHHHHAICTRCDAVTTVSEAPLETIIRDIADLYDFTPTAHHFELRGICKNCQQKSAR